MGTEPRGQTPSDGGMLTSEREDWGAVGGPDGAVELGKISRGGEKGYSQLQEYTLQK